MLPLLGRTSGTPRVLPFPSLMRPWIRWSRFSSVKKLLILSRLSIYVVQVVVLVLAVGIAVVIAVGTLKVKVLMLNVVALQVVAVFMDTTLSLQDADVDVLQLMATAILLEAVFVKDVVDSLVDLAVGMLVTVDILEVELMVDIAVVLL